MEKEKYTITYIDKIDKITAQRLSFDIQIQRNNKEKIVRVHIPRMGAEAKEKIDINNMTQQEEKRLFVHALVEIRDFIKSGKIRQEGIIPVRFNWSNPVAELSTIGWSIDDFLARKPLCYP